MQKLQFFLGDFLDLETLKKIQHFIYLKNINETNILLYDNSSSTLIYDLPFFSFRNNYLNNYIDKIKLDSSFLGITLGLDLRIDAPLIYLILKQKLINFNSQLIGFGIKSLASYNFISQNIADFFRFLEGKSYVCNFIKTYNEMTYFIQILYILELMRIVIYFI